MDGFYHGLEVGEAGDDRWVFMNLNGRIHMHGIEGHFEPVTWFEVMAAQSPHEVVRLVESRMSWDVSSADRTTPRSLTYRVLAGCLTQRLNDRNGWTVADGRTEAGDSDWAEGDSTFLSEFEGAHRSFWDAGGDREALARLWVLRSGERRVALLSDSGYLYRRGRPEVEMLPRYRARRALDDVTRLVLDEADDL